MADIIDRSAAQSLIPPELVHEIIQGATRYSVALQIFKRGRNMLRDEVLMPALSMLPEGGWLNSDNAIKPLSFVRMKGILPFILWVASDLGKTNRRNTSFKAINILDLPEAFEPYKIPNLYKKTPSATSVTSSDEGPFAKKLNSCLSRMER